MNKLPLGKIAGSAAIIQDKKILLLQRTKQDPKYPGHWTFPAGGIEETDASIQDTVIREVREETDLLFTPERKFNFYESIFNGKRYISLVHLGMWSGQIRPQQEEVSDFRFFTYEETKSLDIAFAYRQVLDDLHTEGLIS